MKRSHPILLGLLAAALSLAHVVPASSALAANPPAAKQTPAAVAKKATSLLKIRAKIPPAKNLPAKNFTAKPPAADEAVAPRLTLSLAMTAPMAAALPDTLAPAPAPTVMQPARVAVSAAPAPVNPYLAYRQETFAAPVTVARETPVVDDAPREKANLVSQYFSGFQLISPVRPPSDQSILPTFKKVYPTGEKPLVVVTFKCPTELVGITPLPTKALHGLVDLGMGALNSSNLLSFNMQQVCQ
jgi:hypothetical protein